MNANPSPSDSRQKTVLIIDDDPHIAETIGAVLAAEGFRILVGRDGTEGLALAERNRPELIVVDMMMPRRSGFLVVEAVRQGRAWPTRIVMITANEGSRHRKYAERLGVDAYLHKPFPIAVFLETVRKLFADATPA